MSKKSNFDVTPYTKQGYSQEVVLEVKASFDLFDTDQSGFIDVKQLKAAMVSLGLSTKHNSVWQMLSKLDKDGTGNLDFNEFFVAMVERVQDNYNKSHMLKIFAAYDPESKGYIATQDLVQVAARLGETISREEINEMIQRADLDKDGVVSEEEFYAIITKKV